ncbi:MAG: hypothetical protein AB7F25_03835 [Deferribacterales bacterium]
MKVFLSWSGELSHRIATVLRDWFPSVIQSIDPYVSSEDIDKGTRWSTDIAKELEDSSFGILCVTKGNIDAPWLNFEAGALSKAINYSFVCPFLFGLKRSEINGPILQFQSTVFEKEDIRKLIHTLNKACCDITLTDDRINKAFDVWYPTLEEQLKSLESEAAPVKKTKKPEQEDEKILEEILNISRINHRILRATEKETDDSITEIKKQIDELSAKYMRPYEMNTNIMKRKFHPMMFEEFLHYSLSKKSNYIGILLTLSFFKSDLPWIYEASYEAINMLKQTDSYEVKKEIIANLNDIFELSIKHPMFREVFDYDPKMRMMSKDISRLLIRAIENVTFNQDY